MNTLEGASFRDELSVLDQGVRAGEAFPGGFRATKAVDDPGLRLQQLRVGLQVVVVRDVAATGSERDHVQGIGSS
jgi:hypothetical protein